MNFNGTHKGRPNLRLEMPSQLLPSGNQMDNVACGHVQSLSEKTCAHQTS